MINAVQTEDLIKDLKNFLSGKNELNFANEIEGKLIEIFAEDDEIIEEMVAFALYRPGGGEHLFNEKDMIPIYNNLIKLLSKRISNETGN